MSEWDPSADEERIRELIRVARECHLAELTVEEDGVAVTVRLVAPSVAVILPQAASAPDSVSANLMAEPAEQEEPGTYRVEGPMAGVFYRAPSPDSPPFVEAGSHVEPGDTIGLIEAMKVFNEIKVEVAGEVIELLVKNEELVAPGQALLKIRLDGPR